MNTNIIQFKYIRSGLKMLQPSQGLIFDRMCGSLRGSVDLGYGTEARKDKGSRNDNFVYSK